MTWWYRNGEYLADEGDANLIRRVYAACEGEKTPFVDEVVKQIKYRSTIIPADAVFPIRFRNGILRQGDFITMKDYTNFTPYFIDINYKPDAAPVQIVDEYIDNLTINPTQDIIDRCEFFNDIPDSFLSVYNALWSQVKNAK